MILLLDKPRGKNIISLIPFINFSKRKNIVLFICFLNGLQANAQIDSTWHQKPQITITGFVDAFYVYDFNRPVGNRQDFFFNHNRHNEFNINNAVAFFALEHQKYRMNLALHAGTYAQDNYAHEQVMLRALHEANVGISLNKKNTLWLDAGIFGSHMGFESALSIDNPTLTRSFVAENSPYYLSGAKLTYNLGEKWELAAIVSNGWQRIQRLEGNSIPSGGTQVVFKPTDNFLLNWSTFATTEFPDSLRRMRYFNNLYANFKLGKKISVITGFDFGIEQATFQSSNYNEWFAPVIITRYDYNNHWGFAIRGEYFHDAYGTIIPVQSNASEFKTTAISANIDYRPSSNLALRVEGRYLSSTEDVLPTSQGFSNNNFFLALSLAVKFSEKLNK
jgi:hypothetical protein